MRWRRCVRRLPPPGVVIRVLAFSLRIGPSRSTSPSGRFTVPCRYWKWGMSTMFSAISWLWVRKRHCRCQGSLHSSEAKGSKTGRSHMGARLSLSCHTMTAPLRSMTGQHSTLAFAGIFLA